jgi:radical SAM protein with 4Fe4S-binding SPASM domain
MDFIDNIKQVEIETTNFCNANCVFCPREKLTRHMGIMEFRIFKKIINDLKEFKNLYKIRLSGFGDPLLDNGIFKKIKYAKANLNCLVQFNTNALLLNEDIARRLILSGLDNLMVSLYATRKENYEKIHGNKNFKIVKQNVINFTRLKKELHKKKPILCMSFLRSPENLEKKESWTRFWNRYADEILIETDKPFNFTYGREYNPVNKDIRKITCLRPFNMTNIYWDGNVSLCCVDFNAKMVFGNVKEKSLKEILESPDYQRAIYYHKKGYFKKLPLCENCDCLVPATIRNKIARFIFLHIKKRYGGG